MRKEIYVVLVSYKRYKEVYTDNSFQIYGLSLISQFIPVHKKTGMNFNQSFLFCVKLRKKIRNRYKYKRFSIIQIDLKNEFTYI